MDASNLAVLRDALYRELAARRGTRRTVVIVDEAQNLDLDVLGQLYLLSNLEIDGRKLLKILLIGEPGLLERLGRTTLHPPSHATTGYYLLPLAEDETCAYVRHRLAIAGGRDVFEAEALRDVHHLSSGVPRLINTICDRALSSAVAQRPRIVDRSQVHSAATRRRGAAHRWRWAAGAPHSARAGTGPGARKERRSRAVRVHGRDTPAETPPSPHRAADHDITAPSLRPDATARGAAPEDRH